MSIPIPILIPKNLYYYNHKSINFRRICRLGEPKGSSPDIHRDEGVVTDVSIIQGSETRHNLVFLFTFSRLCEETLVSVDDAISFTS